MAKEKEEDKHWVSEAELARETYRLVEENNKMLRHMRVWSIIRFSIYIVIILLPLIAALIFIPPFITSTVGSLSGAAEGVGKIGEIFEFVDEVGGLGTFEGSFKGLFGAEGEVDPEVQRAIESLEGIEPGPDGRIPEEAVTQLEEQGVDPGILETIRTMEGLLPQE